MRKISVRQRLINMLVRTCVVMGIGPDFLYVLKIPGRKSGKLRAVPVSLLVVDGERWIVAGFQEANWVKNASAAGWGILIRGRIAERIALVEVKTPAERAPLLREKLRRVQATRRRIQLSLDAPLSEFEAIAPLYPTFRIAQFSLITQQTPGIISTH